MKLEITNQLLDTKDDFLNNLEKTMDEMELDEKINNLTLDNETITKEITYPKDTAVDKTIDNIAKTLEDTISMEVDKLNLNESIWEKISKSAFADVVKVSIEAVIKGVLKKKFGINYSTFNDMKDTIRNVMDGNLKDALKDSSSAAIDKIKVLDGTTKTTIKTVKNAVIDKVIDSEKFEIINKQTKLLNKISEKCEKFNEAMKTNDEKQMKSTVKSLKKDMEEILPIRETISKAQAVLDKYALWESKGKETLSIEENELIDKLNMCA